MIVDHADGLHQGIANGWAHKGKSPFAHVLAHDFGFRAGGGNLIQIFPVVLDGTMIHKLPNVVVKASKF